MSGRRKPRYQSFIAAATNYHQNIGLKQHKSSILWFQGLEVQNHSHWAKVKVSAGLVLSGGCEGRICFLSPLSYQKLHAFLGSRPLPAIAPISCFYLHILSGPPASLIQTIVITWAHLDSQDNVYHMILNLSTSAKSLCHILSTLFPDSGYQDMDIFWETFSSLSQD